MKYLRREQPKTVSVSGGVVLPLVPSESGVPLFGIGGVLDRDGNYVPESAQTGKGDTADRFSGSYPFDGSKVIESDEEVIYIGAFVEHWGHFLLDVANRLWIFAGEDADKDKTGEHDLGASGRDARKVIYCSNGEKIDGVFLDFFKALGVSPDRLLRISEPTRFRKILIPEQSYMACDYYTEAYRRVFEKVKKNLDFDGLIPYEKIYLSRAHFKRAKEKEIGGDLIEENFRANGFQSLYMEELSFREQVFYLNRAKQIAAFNGTPCHNIVFAGPETEFIVLDKTSLPNTHQKILEEMTGCRVSYINVYREPFRHFPMSYGEGPFFLDAVFLGPWFRNRGMRFRAPSKGRRFRDFLKYTSRCITMKGRKSASAFYAKTYRRISRIEWIIKPLRAIRERIAGKS
ncbi:MAG: glycosyltransferase family 61 protein [Lachnospiraceae bacterium]|nr:glycosyltransferase family 61 protein [Lachnospiraceae bacterium]